MKLLDLFLVASMPVLKVLVLTALGLFLALDRVDVLGENARKQLNTIIFFVFNPALVSSNLSKAITLETVILMRFMPLNILATFVIGSALGWLLIKITRPPQRLKGLVLGCCAAGNLGNLPLIIIPAVCKEKGSPFGAPNICYTYGMTYASLSLAIGAIFLWSYVYNIVRISSSKVSIIVNSDELTSRVDSIGTTSELHQGNCSSTLIPPNHIGSASPNHAYKSALPFAKYNGTKKVPSSLGLSNFQGSILEKIKHCLRMFSNKINLKKLFAPSIIGAVVGFIIGMVPQLRNIMIGSGAPLNVVHNSASLLGDVALPTVTLIMGGNLLKGLKSSGTLLSLILGIIAVRYIALPLLGIVIVRSATHFGLVHSDPLYQFVLLLQYALPPAINIGTMTQLFGAGESECSVIMLWTYALASVSLTLWSTFFMWLVV
ncbi:protein PIN-LIKES 3 isoform X2 [Ziziphus jujuba]|uniref:Protein PIN-LIKES 3 isoform X2 n=1 Tax=Ziziphus jujuba TaxID=326968 RepID=A0ABM3ITL5_ZIZJJ|nr:protein PIN-LIKES 3 isoform X2 [Ziziphus jujuba]